MVDSDIRVVDKVNYVTDLKSKLEIRKFLFRTCGIGNYAFENILAKLDFDLDKKLYLKRKDTDKFYYSYDKDNFSEDDMIEFKKNYIIVGCKGYMNQYRISKDNNKENEILILNEFTEKEIKCGDISYYFMANDIMLKIIIKNNKGEEFNFLCDRDNFYRRRFSDLENNNELEQYISNINFSDLLEDIFSKLCQLTDIFEYIGFYYMNISLKYLKNNVVESSYDIRKDRMRKKITVKVKNKLREVYYEFVSKEEYYNSSNRKKGSITLKNEDYELKFEVIKDDTNYEIKNEEELRKYLLGLECPIKIEEVFKKICEISLGDVGEYYRIYISIYDDENLDRIILEKDKLIEFRFTRDGKMYEFDENGNFYYRNNDKISAYSVDMNGDIITEYKYRCQTGIGNNDNNNDRIMYKAIKEAKEGKVKTRKLIDELIKSERK